MRLPEWEIEEAVFNNPSLAETPGSLTELKIIARQEYLPSINGYIDILGRVADRYVIIEIKSGIVGTLSPIRDQLFAYRKAFCEERNQRPTDVLCVLLAQDFREEVREFAESNGVHLKKVAWEDIVASRPTGKAGITKLGGYERTSRL
ncbi:MAG: endonuclease NucS domain-containing protein, partial [Candidatus Geothermarchaeales archaeon]